MATRQYTLGKKERLKSRKLIEQVFNEGDRFNTASLRVFYLRRKEEKAVLQLGVGVSSKIFKKAVERNRIKRLLRETWRLQKNPLYDVLLSKEYSLIAFINYTGKELPVYREMEVHMQKVITKLINIISTNN